MKMKNKKAGQIEAKKRHLESIKKKRRNEPELIRSAPTRAEKPILLIVCEGVNTEPSYFHQFRLSSAVIKPIGEGYNTLSLVERAIQLSAKKKYDQVWCVFDADPKPDNPNQAQNFNAAIMLAKKCNFGIAYSNQAFEYWIILHFDDHQAGAMNRSDYDKKLNDLLKPYGVKYDGKKSKIISEEIFELLDGIDDGATKSRKVLAIERAKRNYAFFDHSNPAKEESSTTVFRLIEEITKYI